MFTDTHCHIYKEYYSDIDEIIKMSIKTNVTKWINNGVDTKTNKEILDMSKKYNDMYVALGIHPENVDNYCDDDIKFIIDNLNNNKVVAIGEIGLDYHYTKENKKEQIILFEKQLEIAEKYNLPVIVHSREATLDTINTLKKHNVKGVIHSFSGSLETAKEYIKMGFLLGLNGVITFKNSNIKDIYRDIPLEYILLETDSPYLTPEPYRGRQNQPKNIIEIAKFIGNIKNISKEEVSNITEENIKKLYKI